MIEASSGSTAVSEAYFARMLELPFIAVMHRNTSAEKIALIEREGGSCNLVDDAAAVYDVSRQLALEHNGYFMDQFTYAERATDWRGNNNIAESIFDQLALEPHPEPSWIVVGAGTGGTSATIGRYLRLHGHAARLCVVDPEGSAFLPDFAEQRDHQPRGSRIEGIGRPRVEPSFVPSVVDRMIGVPDAASVAAMHTLHERTGLCAGPSTGPAGMRCFGWRVKCVSAGSLARSSHCSATAAPGMPTRTAMQIGSPPRDGTCSPFSAYSTSPGTRGNGRTSA